MKVRTTFVGFLVGGVAVALALAVFLGPLASSEPDGLERVAIDQRLGAEDEGDAADDAPTSSGLAGAIGVAATFSLAGGLFLLVRRLGGTTREPATS